MPRWVKIVLGLGLLVLALAGPAEAKERRLALLIGNEAYSSEVGVLANPHEDVERIRQALLQSGFAEADITILKDGTQIEINKAVARFARALDSDPAETIGFFYYSGHGGSAESGGVRANYLIPTGEPVLGVSDLPVLGVPVNNVMNTLGMTKARSVFIVIDACRVSLPITDVKGGAGAKGMVRVAKRTGLFVAFATADGAVAQDDGLFSTVLAEHLVKPYQDASRMFTLAMREVTNRRRSSELPNVVDGLSDDFCFVSCPISARDMEERDWQLLSTIGRPEAVRTYLSKYPAGRYAETARKALQDLGSVIGVSRPARVSLPNTLQAMRTETANAAMVTGREKAMAGDLVAAAAAFRTACETGEMRGCFELARYAFNGWGIEVNRVVAFDLSQAACDVGVAEGCALLGFFYLGEAGFPADGERARSLLERGCNGGDVQACLNLGVAYERGTGGEVDLQRALQLYVDACEYDEAFCTYVGVMFENGLGVEQDAEAAASFYAYACRASDSTCSYLGSVLDAGVGVPEDAEAARGAFSRACAADDARGCVRLAEMQTAGRGGPVDDAGAEASRLRACELGDSTSCGS